MAKLPACLVFALAACGSSNSKSPDAQVIVDAAPDARPIDAAVDAPAMVSFACSSNPAPTTANAMVSYAGTVTEFGLNGTTPTLTPLAGATVVACKGNCAAGNKLATATSNASGAFTDGPFATGGTPLVAYLHMTHSGDEEIYSFPPVPVTKDVSGVPVLTFSSTLVSLLPVLGCSQQAANGMVVIAATDCNDTRITDSANVTVSVKQGGSTAGDMPIDLGAQTSMAAGLFLVCNVPPGATTVGATYMGHTFLAHSVTSFAGTMTESMIRPGYY
jgi:hypothetical protein